MRAARWDPSPVTRVRRPRRGLGLIRFDGRPRSGVLPRKDVHHGKHGEEEPRPRRSFTPEYKGEIVELCRRGDRSVGQVAKDFDLTEAAVRDWVKQTEVDAGEHEGLTSSEREGLAALRRENRGCGRTWRSSSGPRWTQSINATGPPAYRQVCRSRESCEGASSTSVR
ncbi:transposase [Streptomyces chiangmaiensis]|uniref:transposase n=1 Tax=Streptomyces chiangmaiensis TaxID=766497 RepID=UPI0036371D56